MGYCGLPLLVAVDSDILMEDISLLQCFIFLE